MSNDLCGASALAQYVGQPVQNVPVPAGKTVRVIKPGMMVTQDYKAERLNIHVDANGTVTSFRCG